MLGVLLQAKQCKEFHGSPPYLVVPNRQEQLTSRPAVTDPGHLMGAELLLQWKQGGIL